MNYGTKRIPHILTYLVLSLWALTTIYPFIWVALNSFRKKGLILSDSFSIPLGESFTWDNYITAWQRADFKNAYLNSFLISGTVTVFVVIIAGLAAYGLVRYRFRGRNLLYSLIMAGMMFPVFSTIIPVFRLEVMLGIAGTGNRWLSLLAVILPQIAGNLCFAIIILMGFIQSVPIDLEESAYLDGCSVFQIYFHIIMPAAKSSFATVAIFAFLWSYNDLFTQSFFLRYPQERAITGLLNEISSQAGVNYGLMASSVVLVVIPVLIVYICLQKHIIRGLTAGAIRRRCRSMYRVVLIDDERMIVEGLRRVIPWQEYRCEVAGTAEDAASGAALIREVHPHIVFTDIRMPGEDGLTMLAGLRSEFPDMQVSVLTGYRDFSYAGSHASFSNPPNWMRSRRPCLP